MNLLRVAIATRYNVRSPFAKPGFDPNDSEWLAGRRRLFEEFCAPSVSNQTMKEFEWFVLIDDQMTIEEEKWIQKVGRCQTIRCGSQTEGMEKVRDILIPGAVALLTARLDSDDSIAPAYIETLVNTARAHLGLILERNHGLSLSFANGLENDTEQKNWFDRYYPNNPFISLLEPAAGTPRLVYQHAHYDMARHYDALTLANEQPMWCIRVHGGNVANEVKGSLREYPPVEFA